MSINGYSEWWGWDGIRRLYLYRKERRKEGKKEGRKERRKEGRKEGSSQHNNPIPIPL